MMDVTRIICQDCSPNCFASLEVWMVRRLSSRTKAPNPTDRYGMSFVLLQSMITPSTIRKIPQARSYWNARQ